MYNQNLNSYLHTVVYQNTFHSLKESLFLCKYYGNNYAFSQLSYLCAKPLERIFHPGGQVHTPMDG